MTSRFQQQFWDLLGPEARRLLKIELDIRTSHDRPPIPDRQFDWSAIHPSTYDGSEDSSTRNHVGYGRTESEAIVDLCRLDQEQYEYEHPEELDE